MKKLLPLSDFMLHDIKAQLSAETMKKKIDFPAIPFSSAFIKNAIISCCISSNETYPAAPFMNSNINQINVMQKITFTIAFSSCNQKICSCTAVDLTAYTAGGGGNPFYHCKVIGDNKVPNISIFSYTLNKGDKVLFVMTSSLPCVLSVASNIIIVNVTPSVKSSLKISGNDHVCAVISAIFTDCPAAAGKNPLYAHFEKNVVQTPYNTTHVNNEVISSNQLITNGGLSDGDNINAPLASNTKSEKMVISAKRNNKKIKNTCFMITSNCTNKNKEGILS